MHISKALIQDSEQTQEITVMRSLIDYYASLRSQRAFLLLIALISLGVTAFRASDRWEARSLLAVVDTTPMLLGLMVVVVVSGVWSAGSLNYYLLRYPSGNQVFAKVVLAAVIYAEAAAIAVFALSATEAFLISLVLGESFSAMTLIQALLRLLLLVGLFAFLQQA
ncbi:hypothetical protein [Arcanobacterium hippocoleae]|uniref:hypothetical protein n=1 Tax=Arcanobacterium hippocoleae TaxID=149017 RepID=UPI003341F9EA